RMRKFTLDTRARRKRGAEADVATDGSFRLDAPKSGDFFVQVDSDTLFFDLYPKQRGESADPIRLRARRGVVLRGRVASPDGAPVGGARVFYYSSQVPAMWGRVKTPREIDTTSAADGSFTLRAVPASEAGSVTASKTGYASTTTPRRADGDAPLAVVLVPGGRLIGRVVRSDGAPVEGASVSPLGSTFSAYMNDVAERDPSITRGDGAFDLADLMPGRVKLRAEREGLRPATHDGVDVRPGATVDVGVIVMPKGSRLAGEVQTPDGEPSPGAVVTLGFSMQTNQLEPGEGGATTSDQETTTADAQGRFAFEGMGRGPYDLEATASGFAPARRKRFLDDGKTIVLKLRRPGAVEGTVRASGDASPLADFEISIEQQRQFGPAFSVNERMMARAFHAADGRYRVEDVPPGTYAVIARSKGFARGRITDVKVVASSPAQADFDLVPGVTVAGTVVDRTTRRGLPGARVSLMLSMMDLFRQDLPEATADDDGRFTLPDLDPGLVAVSGLYPGRARATVTVGDLAPGARADGVEIALASGGAISGIAFGEDGLPMAGGLATANSPAFGEFRQVTLDTEGRFQIPNLAPGTYQVSILRGSFLSESGGANTAAMLQGMRFATAEVKEGETCFLSIGTESEKVVAVRGRVRSGGAPVAGALVAAIPRGESASGVKPRFTSTDPEGRFELKVPPGRTTFQVQRGGFAQTGV
ncbi:MAG TPA: carboxypeptidase-like regulatory domain-containing protein, partial [Planctomycetota bacterium]|nr:carboxypeptidase-like regulatory domain-containing protein [Planctomycetota bacterium]